MVGAAAHKCLCFFFNDPATTEIYTLSLHDALPIFLSTALVPLAAMPAWMAVLARLNPMTWAIDAVRPLILSGWAAALPKIGIVVIVMTVFDSVCLFGAARAFRRTLG